jgi:hypothetical protein
VSLPIICKYIWLMDFPLSDKCQELEWTDQKGSEINIILGCIRTSLAYKFNRIEWRRTARAPVVRERTHKAVTTSANAVRATCPMRRPILMSKINTVFKKILLITLRNLRESNSGGADRKKKNRFFKMFKQ